MKFSYWVLLKKIISFWSIDNISQLSAALAYYTIFSITPLILICTTLIGFVLGKENVKSQVLNQIRNVIGKDSANQVNSMIEMASHVSTNTSAAIIGIIVLFLGLMGFFWELQTSINKVWGVKAKEGLGIYHFIKHRLLSFILLLGIVFLLMVSLLINIVIAAISHYLHNYISQTAEFWILINFIISFVIITFLFAMIFKILPDVKIKWRDVLSGSIFTALLFTLGKLVLELYITNAHVGSAYGAAGSLIVILIWVYYSAQILFIGVEFTKANLILKGHKIIPANYAIISES